MMSNMRVEFLRMAIENLGRVCNRTEGEVEDTNQQSQENPHAS